MPTRVSDRLTVIDAQTFLNALGYCWVQLFNQPAEKESLLVLMAQSALETGRWKYIHNYNLGNAKSVDGDGRDFSFYACNEIFPLPVAAAYEAGSTSEHPAKITEKRSDGKAVVWFYPEHPGCRFRSYQVVREDGTIDEWTSLIHGMTDYLGLLHDRFRSAWERVLDGDAAGFVDQLHAHGYFTADLAGYKNSVVSLFNEFRKLPLDYDSLPVMSEASKQSVMNLVTITIDEYIRST